MCADPGGAAAPQSGHGRTEARTHEQDRFSPGSPSVQGAVDEAVGQTEVDAGSSRARAASRPSRSARSSPTAVCARADGVGTRAHINRQSHLHMVIQQHDRQAMAALDSTHRQKQSDLAKQGGGEVSREQIAPGPRQATQQPKKKKKTIHKTNTHHWHTHDRHQQHQHTAHPTHQQPPPHYPVALLAVSTPQGARQSWPGTPYDFIPARPTCIAPPRLPRQGSGGARRPLWSRASPARATQTDGARRGGASRPRRSPSPTWLLRPRRWARRERRRRCSRGAGRGRRDLPERERRRRRPLRPTPPRRAPTVRTPGRRTRLRRTPARPAADARPRRAGGPNPLLRLPHPGHRARPAEDDSGTARPVGPRSARPWRARRPRR